MKLNRRSTTGLIKKVSRAKKSPAIKMRKQPNARTGKMVSYNGALTVLYNRDIKETDAAAAILANSDKALLKVKYARYEK